MARGADGVALHLGEQVIIEGVVTVDAGIFANNKLKVFAQDGGAAIMIFHENSADVRSPADRRPGCERAASSARRTRPRT